MKDTLHHIELVALLPTNGGTAVFLRGDSRTFVIQIDPYLGQLIEWYRHGMSQPRPLTHDLFASLVKGIGGEVQRLVIHETRDEVFFAQLRVVCEDDLGRKLVMDLDCRPSDGLALSQLLDVPVYATGTLLDEVEEMSGLLEDLQNNQLEQLLLGGEPDEGEDDEDENFDFPPFNPDDDEEAGSDDETPPF